MADKPRCDIEIYTTNAINAGVLLPSALRINGEVVWTPKGTVYTATGGGGNLLTLTLQIMPTSLKFLPGPPPSGRGDDIQRDAGQTDSGGSRG
ncbi:hypothetical protein ACIODS_12150 [Micromonospora chalcea]|uniref:hypothetical protein n=1 Tax=Micromonospora chalcea TaxID=1874 RepID=UPI0038152A13